MKKTYFSEIRINSITGDKLLKFLSTAPLACMCKNLCGPMFTVRVESANCPLQNFTGSFCLPVAYFRVGKQSSLVTSMTCHFPSKLSNVYMISTVPVWKAASKPILSVSEMRISGSIFKQQQNRWCPKAEVISICPYNQD